MRARSLLAVENGTVRQNDVAMKSSVKAVLAVDVGGSSVKILATGQSERPSFLSGPTLTPKRMVSGVKKLAGDWMYDLVSIGYPGPVLRGRPIAEPYNLGRGWVGFDFGAAFGCPVKVVNDAAMQALGSYKGGKMLFLGLGTGLGSSMIVDGIIEPMEFGHLPYKGTTYEDHVGIQGLKRLGKKTWRKRVADVVSGLVAAFESDDVVLGGGNVKDIPRAQNAPRLRSTPARSRTTGRASRERGLTSQPSAMTETKGRRKWQHA